MNNQIDSLKNDIYIRINDMARSCVNKNNYVFSDYFNPSEAEYVFKAVDKLYDVKYMVFGGNDQCERRIIGFCPVYLALYEQLFPLNAVKIGLNKKFSTDVSHRDYLGSIIALGIDRRKIGDILIFDGSAICYVKKEISDYIASNITKIGKNSVAFTEVLNIGEFELKEPKTEEKSFTVPSLRLDVIAGGAFNIARGKIKNIIESERVFVNFVTETSVSKNINENDIITVRGFGRIKVLSVNGRTKKERISITVLKYVWKVI